ncbi:MAG: hypothetical protein J6Q41_06430 [Firmicutes bacterium]|nr:hypothetical protein [Bacillota bacterium]
MMIIFYGVPLAAIVIPVAMIVGIVRNSIKLNDKEGVSEEQSILFKRRIKIEAAVLIIFVVCAIALYIALQNGFMLM